MTSITTCFVIPQNENKTFKQQESQLSLEWSQPHRQRPKPRVRLPIMENCGQTAEDGHMVTIDSLQKVVTTLSAGTIVLTV